jgi:hypothetical protein
MGNLYDHRVLRFGPRAFHQDPHLSRLSSVRIPQVFRSGTGGEGGGGGAGGQGGGQGGGTGSGAGAGTGSGSGQGGGTGSGGEGAGKVFTEAEVNAMIASRGEQWARNNFPDYDKFKAAATELEQIREANQTETEKAIKKAKDEGKTEAEQAAAGALAARDAQYASRLFKAEIKSQAAGLNFADPADVVALIEGEYIGTIKLTKDGDLSGHEGLDERLKKLAKDKPYLVKGSSGGQGGGTPIPGGGGGTGTGNGADDRKAAAARNANALLVGGGGGRVRRPVRGRG